jgi:hypothetical protein
MAPLEISGVALVPKIACVMGCPFKFVELRSEHRAWVAIYTQSKNLTIYTAWRVHHYFITKVAHLCCKFGRGHATTRRITRSKVFSGSVRVQTLESVSQAF